MLDIILHFIILATSIMSLSIFSIKYVMMNEFSWLSLISGLIGVFFMVWYPSEDEED
jgi:hypothetical protein